MCPSTQQSVGCGGISSGGCTPYLITLSLSLAIALPDFSDAVRQTVREQLALTAGMTRADSNRILLVAVVAADAGRRLLSQGVSFEVEFSMLDADSAAVASSKLTQANIDSSFAFASLPKAHITAPVAVHAPAVAAVAIQVTPAPTLTVGGLPISTIIAIVSSVVGAVGLTVIVCCFQRLDRCGCLPETAKSCLPKWLYMDSEQLQASNEQRIANGTARQLVELLQPGTAQAPTASLGVLETGSPIKSATGFGSATAPDPIFPYYLRAEGGLSLPYASDARLSGGR